MTWDYRQNLRSVTNHLNLENGRFFISNFMWLNFQNLVARYINGCLILVPVAISPHDLPDKDWQIN